MIVAYVCQCPVHVHTYLTDNKHFLFDFVITESMIRIHVHTNVLVLDCIKRLVYI